MNSEIKLNQLVKEHNGIFTYEDLIKYGFSRKQIKVLENNGIIERIGRGIYNHKDYLLDMMKVYQMENKKLIYSNETAAYIHDLTDRFPRSYSVTTESGYHLRKARELKVYYIKNSEYEVK